MSTTERDFLDRYDPTRWDRPSVAVDVVLLTVLDGALHVLLVERSEHPFRGTLALPGGFVGIDQSLDAAARAVLARKTGLDSPYLEQLFTFGTPERDPRMRVISVAYYALVPASQLGGVRSGLHPVEVSWEGEVGGPATVLGADGRPALLAFDHPDILGMAVLRKHGCSRIKDALFTLLLESFPPADRPCMRTITHLVLSPL